MIDLHFIRENNCIIFECISGSKSYGLSLPTSDTDIKGIYILPKENFYGLDYVEQISNETNDIVFYELKRFIELLSKNNPNILELLNVPEECIIYKHPLIEKLTPEIFLSKQCQSTFANYAFAQIKKAKGLNKKIYNPIDEERKNILHFCYVTEGNNTQPLLNWLTNNNIQQEDCGLSALNNMRGMYALYYDKESNLSYKGIMSKENSNEVSLSSIPKGIQPINYLFFNKDAYSIYCKDYREYWDWVEKRNDVRYENTLEHGKNYDAKNMQHVFRLLNMADEIAIEKKINTYRPDRKWLLKIRSGAFMYEKLIQMAEEKLLQIKNHYEESDLPEFPDKKIIENLLVEMREEFYSYP
jgi:hypothetical protein